MASPKLAWKLQDYNAHVGSVKCLTLGQKTGRFLATGGEDNKVNIWALDKPNCLMSLTGHSRAVSAVRMNDAETVLASGCDLGTVKIWDLEAAKNILSMPGHKGASVRYIAFYPMEDYVASASVDGNVKLWDIRRKGCIHTYRGHESPVSCSLFTPDSRWMITGDDSGIIKIWSIMEQKLVHEFKGHRDAITAVRCHPTELLLASSSRDGTVKFWDLCTMKPLSCTSSDDKCHDPFRSIVFHPEGVCVYAARKGTIGVYDWEPSKLYQTVDLPDGCVVPVDVAIAHDHDQLIGACVNQSNVSTFVVEINKVAPISSTSSVRHLQSGDSGRKTFVAANVVAPPPKESKKPARLDADDDGGGDNGVDVRDPDLFKDRDKPKPLRPPVSAGDDEKGGVSRQAGNGGGKRLAIMSESEAHSFLQQGHSAFMTVISRRHRNLRILKSEWLSSGHRTAVDVAVGMKDHSVMTDLLKVLLSDVELWDLGLCQTLLPVLGEMISSKHESYMHIGLSSLRLIGHQFGDLIRTNVATPPPQGMVDFSRQERYVKCLSCYNALLSIRTTLEQNSNRHDGRLGEKFREMLALIQRIVSR